VANMYTSSEISLAEIGPNYSRADIEFLDVDHSGASYEARVFINNPSADENTEKNPENGYAGSFHIFGHGGCFGDVGHCDVRPRRLYDPRPAHPLTPARKVVIATDAVRRAQAEGKPVTITVVPIVTSTTPKADVEEVFQFGEVKIVAYQ
jgi:hypothetical protein